MMRQIVSVQNEMSSFPQELAKSMLEKGLLDGVKVRFSNPAGSIMMGFVLLPGG